MGVKACWDSGRKVEGRKTLPPKQNKGGKSLSQLDREPRQALSDYIAQVHCTKKGHKRKG